MALQDSHERNTWYLFPTGKKLPASVKNEPVVILLVATRYQGWIYPEITGRFHDDLKGTSSIPDNGQQSPFDLRHNEYTFRLKES